jgi:hypothetical protein
MKELPTGIQSFEDLRSNNYLYVDKTEDIYRLITSKKIVFLSRPRRFGKSLLVSTMEELFKGNKALFEGLYIYDKWDWTQQYPVIRYNGYTWDGKTPVYNPFSTMTFLSKKKFSGYWYSTGTSAFLVERLKKRNLSNTVLEPVVVGSDTFDSYDPDDLGDIPLLFQTGYLTVKEEKLTNGVPLYTFGVPNFEVKEAFMKHFLTGK